MMDRFWDALGAIGIVILVVAAIGFVICQTAILAYSMGWVK